MVVAARTVSQITTHMGIAFSIMYCLTGSIGFGGLAALIEPVINVMLLPLHEHLWKKVRSKAGTNSPNTKMIALEKASQIGLHVGVGFTVMYYATGSMAFGGLAAVLEPICNVILLPFHDRLWAKIGSGANGSKEARAVLAV